MRTQLELWQVVKENFDKYFEYGLCVVIIELFYDDYISNLEHKLLEEELLEHGDSDEYFLGKKGDPKPRLEFIDKMIKKHSENAITENK